MIIKEDIKKIISSPSIPWALLKNKRILITGCTGLIGSLLVKTLLTASEILGLNIGLVLLVRNPEKLSGIVDLCDTHISVVKGSVETFSEYSDRIDYIIHGAYPTASSYFNSNPVETIKSGILGTMNLLDVAYKNQASKFVFLSSMEVYGSVSNEQALCEHDLGSIDLYSSRSCYPESKRMCENVLCCYSKEYGLNTSTIRLAQTFGPGIPSSDKRVFAMMARCAINGEDIVLNTPGQSKHPYLYSAEAVSAILTVLLKGENNACYNAANPDTYCSIYDMGKMVADRIAGGKIKVVVDIKETAGLYPPVSYLNLDITKLEELGWHADIDLEEMFRRMMSCM